MERGLSIILPTSNNLRQLKAAIYTLLNSTDFPFRLIIVESESIDGTKEWLDNLIMLPNNREILIIHTKKEGSIKATNKGILAAGEDDVYLTQDDVIHFRLYARDWLAGMHHICQDPNIGILTPLGCMGKSGPEYLDGLPWVGTWACYIPRTTINKVGIMDETMKIGDDIDFCYRVQKAGLKILAVPYWVDHHQMRDSPHALQDEKTIKEAGEYFRRKHNL